MYLRFTAVFKATEGTGASRGGTATRPGCGRRFLARHDEVHQPDSVFAPDDSIPIDIGAFHADDAQFALHQGKDSPGIVDVDDAVSSTTHLP